MAEPIQTSPVAPLLDATPQVISSQAKKIDTLVSIIRSLTERSPEDLILAVNFEISKLEPLTFSEASSFIRETYNQSFFRLEHDVDFKVSLCRAILQHMRSRNPNYDCPLLESIANRVPEVQELITPIWKV